MAIKSENSNSNIDFQSNNSKLLKVVDLDLRFSVSIASALN